MSYASTILAKLADHAVTLQLDGDMLVPRGQRSSLTAELLAALRRHKPDIVAVLRRTSRLSTDAGPPSGTDDDHGGTLTQRVADISDAYAERIAIVMEAGDMGEAEARQIAEAEIGRRFFEAFVAAEAAS